MIDSKLWLATVVKYDRMMNMRKSVFIFLLAFLLSATSAAAQGVSAPARSVATPPARAVAAANSSAVPLAPPSVVPTTPTPAPVVVAATPTPVATRSAQPVTGAADYTYALMLVGLLLCAGVAYRVYSKNN